MDDDFDGVVANIRACIVSSKEAIPIRNLSRDYETLVGSQIPYRQFKCPTLIDFLMSVPSLRVYGTGSSAKVEAATSNTSQHISALISKQKSTAKKFAPPAPRRSYPFTSYIQGRGGRSRGRGAFRSYSSRDDSTRAPPARDYSEPSRDYNEPSRDYNEPSRDYNEPSRDYSDPPKRYSPNLQTRHSTVQAREGPITVKVEDNKRQVSFRKTELPPRLQKLRKHSVEVPPVQLYKEQTTSASPGSQDFEPNLLQEDSAASPSIISPLGPSQLIAKGRAKQQAEKAKLEQMSSDLWMQSSSQETSNLTADFARLSHQDTFNGSILENLQASFNGQNVQIPEVPSMLHDVTTASPKLDITTGMSNEALLGRFCLSRGWPKPTYTIKHRKCPDTHKVLFLAYLQVNGDGDFNFRINTFPFEHEDESIVKEHAAKEAFKIIIAKQETKVKAVISSDTNIICNRISDIVAGSSSGWFARSVEDEYVKRHNELLPSDWLQAVSSWPSLSVESTVNSTIIVPTDPTSQVQFEFDPTCAPPPLKIQDLGTNDGTESVYVTHGTSTSNIWFRVIGGDYSDKYHELLNNMDTYYKGVGAQELALVMEEGQYYAAHKFGTWFRVSVLQVNNDEKTVLAWLLDHGDSDNFEFGSLYRLAPEFCQLPQQAVQCTLEGLESFNEDEIASEVIADSDLLIDQTLIAQISLKDVESRFLKVTFYDTSGEDDINVNELIKDEIIAKTKPMLPAEGCATEVDIGDVSKKGEVYVTFSSPSFERISEIIESLSPEKISENKLTKFKYISLNKLYLAKYSKDDNWYRAVVTATPSVQHNKVPVRFVDYGNTESVMSTDIVDLENLPAILRKLPPQAVRVALHNLPLETLTNSEVARLHSLLLVKDKTILLKTISLKADPPIVELFTKEADNTALVSVNSTIELQRKIYRNEENKLTSPEAAQFNNHDDFDLAAPDLSGKGHQAISIPLAAHPGNFIFQTAKYQGEMNRMQAEMRAYYASEALSELPINRIMKNKLFAALYDLDDMWYRVVVTDSPKGNKVPVRLCDFGDVIIVNTSNLRELAPEFRIHPFMAVKGKLAGVKPIHKDWSVEDCIRFQGLVVSKLLAGVIVHIENNQNPLDMVVTLNIVDTSTDQDQKIAEILLSEQRAVRDN